MSADPCLVPLVSSTDLANRLLVLLAQSLDANFGLGGRSFSPPFRFARFSFFSFFLNFFSFLLSSFFFSLLFFLGGTLAEGIEGAVEERGLGVPALELFRSFSPKAAFIVEDLPRAELLLLGGSTLGDL
jgi:hypothetical protein